MTVLTELWAILTSNDPEIALIRLMGLTLVVFWLIGKPTYRAIGKVVSLKQRGDYRDYSSPVQRLSLGILLVDYVHTGTPLLVALIGDGTTV